MSIASIAARRVALIRKAQDAVVFAGPDDADPITALTETASATLKTLPPGYTCLGYHTKEDGINWTREVESADTMSHGSPEPTRRDITQDISGLAVIAQETKAQTLEMFHNVDLSGVVPDPTTGEIQITRARTPATRYYRVLALASDGFGDDIIYFARFLPRASVTEFSEQGWTEEEEVRYELTMTAYVDDTLGFSLREFWGGPGLAPLLEAMGFSGS